jgi:hypothetical protein
MCLPCAIHYRVTEGQVCLQYFIAFFEKCDPNDLPKSLETRVRVSASEMRHRDNVQEVGPGVFMQEAVDSWFNKKLMHGSVVTLWIWRCVSPVTKANLFRSESAAPMDCLFCGVATDCCRPSRRFHGPTLRAATVSINPISRKRYVGFANAAHPSAGKNLKSNLKDPAPLPEHRPGILDPCSITVGIANDSIRQSCENFIVTNSALSLGTRKPWATGIVDLLLVTTVLWRTGSEACLCRRRNGTPSSQRLHTLSPYRVLYLQWTRISDGVSSNLPSGRIICASSGNLDMVTHISVIPQLNPQNRTCPWLGSLSNRKHCVRQIYCIHGSRCTRDLVCDTRRMVHNICHDLWQGTVVARSARKITIYTVYPMCLGHYFGTWHCGHNYYSLTILRRQKVLNMSQDATDKTA